jgi:two-component system OmpR family sensor kinase
MSDSTPVALGANLSGSGRRRLRDRVPLRVSLVIAVALIASLVLIISGAATVLALRASVVSQLDAELREVLVGPPLGLSSDQAERGAAGTTPAPPGSAAPADPAGDFLEFPGLGRESIAAVVDSAGTTAVLRTTGGSSARLDPSAVGELSDVPADLTGRTVSVGGLGEYRVMARAAEDHVLVYGLPQEGGRALVSGAAWTTGVAVAVGIAVIAAAVAVIVAVALRPLREVARTAGRVARLPLAQGASTLAERIPETLAGPRTEVGEVARALNTMLAHLDGAFDARHRSETRLRRFVADASHELRTPLTTIRGYAEMLARVPPSDVEAQEQVRSRIVAGAARMSELVEDLLTLARLDARTDAQRSEDVDVTALLLELAEDARVAAPEHAFALDLPAHPVVASAEPHTLRRALLNLVSNAWRHTPPGTRVVLRATVDEASGRVVVEVEDDGPGVPAEIRAEVFERFVRADSGRARSGAGSSGLGLAIARTGVDSMGGRVALLDDAEATVFRVELPAA